jgi:hypothetical protein
MEFEVPLTGRLVHISTSLTCTLNARCPLTRSKMGHSQWPNPLILFFLVRLAEPSPWATRVVPATPKGPNPIKLLLLLLSFFFFGLFGLVGVAEPPQGPNSHPSFCFVFCFFHFFFIVFFKKMAVQHMACN